MLQVDSSPGELAGLLRKHMIKIVYDLLNATKLLHSLAYAVLSLVNLAKLGTLRLEHAPYFKHRLTHISATFSLCCYQSIYTSLVYDI